ncbi:response regulator [Paenibacillus alginolyticus]|uniref:histidine kinase n=1 Tax=Paenibacillus alginolyticus TaxID=59839 RepID=A0ABT4GL89_9BACL|nr:ATP-binding protein [Paenibacillus alginolyticus]MCY9668937.1 response regulator [Paenibacillus alginolyticus]MCY9696819.1 response regulator [Paenibacillus alginolyticus]MEC0147667.1 response regulator [Paenibacillus alginolyticus]
MDTQKNRHQAPKILVVDDRKENLFAMQKILQVLHCEVYVVQSGNEALSYTLRHDFALILLDVNMPEMDGFELAELLRSNEETKHIPIIFVTASNKEDQSVFKGYESGAVDYLFKPVNADILLSKVKIFLELNRRNKELEAIQSELERSNESLREFAQVVSHDLKNPLNVITGLSELLIARHSADMSPKGKEYMNQISATAERMNHLITDLLSYAQLNAKSAAFGNVDLNDVVTNVISDLSSTIEQNEGQILMQDRLPIIQADATQMYQLFQNLIANGLKYRRKEQSPIIQISLLEGNEPDTFVIHIQDNGIGMEKEDIPSIFTPFKRLDNAKAYEGTGLGLATVQKIIERHDGLMEVESKLGEGTTFRVYLPISQGF